MICPFINLPLTLEDSVDKVCVLGVCGEAATLVVVRFVSGLWVTCTKLFKLPPPGCVVVAA